MAERSEHLLVRPTLEFDPNRLGSNPQRGEVFQNNSIEHSFKGVGGRIKAQQCCSVKIAVPFNQCSASMCIICCKKIINLIFPHFLQFIFLSIFVGMTVRLSWEKADSLFFPASTFSFDSTRLRRSWFKSDLWGPELNCRIKNWSNSDRVYGLNQLLNDFNLVDFVELQS